MTRQSTATVQNFGQSAAFAASRLRMPIWPTTNPSDPPVNDSSMLSASS